MPVLESCKPRSPPTIESPPRKKFKFSLKLKPKRKGKTKNPIDSDSGDDSGKENNDSGVNFERKERLNSPLTIKSTNDLTEGNNKISQQTEAITPPLPYAGLANLGNTCYLNAVLQVLRYCPGFLNTLVNLDELSFYNSATGDMIRDNDSPSEDILSSSRTSIVRSMHKLINQMQNAEENYGKFGLEAREVRSCFGWTALSVRPEDFVKEFSGLCPLFSGQQQHDAQEFLRSFLSVIEDECTGLVKGQEDSFSSNINITSSESKVRGGCKYPSTVTSHVTMEPKETTDELSKIQSNCDVGLNNKGGLTNHQTMSSKTLQKSKAISAENINIVKHLFEGTLLLQTCCLNCEGLRQRYENFQDISVPVQNTKSKNPEEQGRNLSDSEDEPDEELNLSWAISKFASTERLNGDNKYFCDNCATLTEANISTYFEKLPQVLTIHLKRFQTSYGNQSLYSNSWVTKVTKSLHMPQQLSVKKWCSKTCSEKNAVYSLFAVVMHSGMSSCSGHYLSYVNVGILREEDGKGMTVDDDDCRVTDSCKASRSSEVQVNDGCVKEGEQYSAKNDKDVKSCSCQGSATMVNSDDVTCHCRLSATKNDINDEIESERNVCKQQNTRNICDAGTKHHSQNKNENVGCETSCLEKKDKDLCCEETLAMDLDEEDTHDYCEQDGSKQISVENSFENTKDTERTVESNTRHDKRISLRSSRSNTVDYNDGCSSDEDEMVIPRSMNITRYFKPISKSSTPKSFNNGKIPVDSLKTSPIKMNWESEDSSSQAMDTAKDVLNPDKSGFKKCSAFNGVLEKSSLCTNKSSENKPLNQGNINPDDSTQNTKATLEKNAPESKEDLQKSPPHCSAFESYQTSTTTVRRRSVSHELSGKNKSSSRQTTENAEGKNGKTTNRENSPESSTSKLESSDGLSAKDKEPFVNNCMRTDLKEQHSQVHSNTTCVDASVKMSEGNNFTRVSDGKPLSCEASSARSSIWLKFDDAEVQDMSNKDMEDILSPSTSCYSTPYLLFYYRC